MQPELEASIARLNAAVEVLYAEVTSLRQLLHGLKPDPLSRHRAAINLIKQAVADAASIRVADLDSRRRPAHIATARQLCMHLLRERLGLSAHQIAQSLGNRDHSGVIQGLRRARELLAIADHEMLQLLCRTGEKLDAINGYTLQPHPRTTVARA
ncbi:MAG: hypothetical protein N3I86_06690 [Verrucomicrobiae bacterium]|nr:hypothetical protein [Verrucomicrobiae bacterium]MDW8310112.1 helix-turn-helix domain-containing protein [Verrucomicrobiales bacterium]